MTAKERTCAFFNNSSKNLPKSHEAMKDISTNNPFKLLSINLIRSIHHSTSNTSSQYLRLLLLSALNHVVQAGLGFVLHSADILHGQTVPLVHLADQLAHGAGEDLNLLRADDVLDQGLKTKVAEGGVKDVLEENERIFDSNSLVAAHNLIYR